MLKRLLENRPVYELADPFPLEKLRELDFGNADGDRDPLAEDAFVLTQSVKLFFQNRHSIIIGPIGSGKSTLFKLIKEGSDTLPKYKNSLIVPIEESISFQLLREIVNEHFETNDEKLVFKVLWKFHIITSISEKLSNLPDFPLSGPEKEVNRFLREIDSKGKQDSILTKLKRLLTEFKPTITTKISNTPIQIDASLESQKSKNKLIINLDHILNNCIQSIRYRRLVDCIVLIDKLDKFVADEDYETQREYIRSLLEVEDDLYKTDFLKFKLFIRSDLFSRLNFSSLGYDKVMDNTLKLEWSNNEVIGFVAKRIISALKPLKLLDMETVLLSTNLNDFDLNGIKILRLLPILPHKIKKRLFNYEKINKERDTGLSEYLNRSVVTKVFPHEISHKNLNGQKERIGIFDFLQNHFVDGTGKNTPRRLLKFLKHVQEQSIYYYDNNPDQKADVLLFNSSAEWNLFKEKSVYHAYIDTKKDSEINIGNIDDKWTRMFVVFQSVRGNKKFFDYKWFKSIFTESIENDLIGFISFLEVIGFLKIYEHNIDLKLRKYELPILYQRTPT